MELLLVQFLRVAWVAATFPIIIASIPTPKLRWLHSILLGFASRGKTMHSPSQVTFVISSFPIDLRFTPFYIFFNFHLPMSKVLIFHPWKQSCTLGMRWGSPKLKPLHYWVIAEIHHSSEVLPALLRCGFHMDNVFTCWNLGICL